MYLANTQGVYFVGRKVQAVPHSDVTMTALKKSRRCRLRHGTEEIGTGDDIDGYKLPARCNLTSRSKSIHF